MTEPIETPTHKAPRRRLIKRMLVGSMLLLLVASVTANFVLFRQFDRTYRELSATQLDPLGLDTANFPADVPSDAAAKTLPTVMFLGDSRARQWPAPNAPGWRYINRGIGGQTTEQVKGRFDLLSAADAPSVSVLQAGINDLKTIPPLPAPARQDRRRLQGQPPAYRRAEHERERRRDPDDDLPHWRRDARPPMGLVAGDRSRGR